jgi:hypothetical protein
VLNCSFASDTQLSKLEFCFISINLEIRSSDVFVPAVVEFALS